MTAGAEQASSIRGWVAARHAHIADARRGHPNVDLSGWARARGLAPAGSQNASGYFAVLPLEPSLQFNVARGVFAGRDVCLWHWRFPQPAQGEDGGNFPGLTAVASSVHYPVGLMNWFFWWWPDDDEPVHAGLPCTGAAALVPEAGMLPRFTIAPSADNLAGRGAGQHDLDALGAPGFTLHVLDRPALPPGVLERAVSGALGAVLRAGASNAVFQVSYRFGTVVIRQDGYADAAGMDVLLQQIRDVAACLADACRPLHRPVPFADPLPAGSWPPPPPPDPSGPAPRLGPGYATAVLPDVVVQGVQKLVTGRRWALEDPVAYTAAFPSNPVPGVAYAVFRTRVPGAPDPVRIALHTEVPLTTNSGRTALLLPSGRAQPTAPGGVKVDHPGVQLRYAISGGLFAFWLLRWRAGDTGDVDLLVRRGLDLARRLGALPDS